MNHPTAPKPHRSLALWAGVLGAPAVWAIQLEVGYALAPRICTTRDAIILHGLTLFALLLAGIGGLISWREWKRAGRGSPEQIDGGPIARSRFLGGLGMAASAYSALVILAQGIASFFLSGCWS